MLWSLGTANTGNIRNAKDCFHKNTKEVANLAPADYPDRFQPASRDQQSDSSSFQEAVISRLDEEARAQCGGLRIKKEPNIDSMAC